MVRLHLVNSFWSLIFNPSVVPIFSIILLMNFFRSLPREMYEAALVDGGGHWRILLRIYLPLSLPALATLTLFSVVGLWNDWFTGLIYLNSPTDYPLQTYLEQIQLQPNFANLTTEQIAVISQLSSQALASARIIIAAVPVIVLYPFLQRYFIKGIVLGAIKG
jgi:putative aldouronate transport system permease protein